MAKVNAKICEICRKEECGGKIFVTPDMWGAYDFHIGVRRVCESDEAVIQKEGKYVYHLVCGHGTYFDYPLSREKASQK